MRADNDLEEYVVSSPIHRQKNEARVQSRSLQRHYNPHRQLTDYDLEVGSRRPVGTDPGQRHIAALRSLNATSHQDPAPSVSQE